MGTVQENLTGGGIYPALARGSAIGTELGKLLLADSIQPGSIPSYELCKTIFSYHPCGAKMVDKPIKMAMSQPREITISHGLQDRVKREFENQWKVVGGRDISADDVIAQAARIPKIYGVGTLALLVEGEDSEQPLDLSTIADKRIAFNILDPLNTGGSLVLSQNPNAVDFMKKLLDDVVVQGRKYHPSRTVIKTNGDPIYLQYVTSGYGYVGRSSYQAALFPLKTFVQTMFTDDMLSRKAGVLVAKVHQPGSISDRIMEFMSHFKRNIVKQAQTDNVIAISADDNEAIETLNLQNAEAPAALSRKHCLQNIALAGDMPAIILNDESYATGLADGTEDANDVSVFVDETRRWLQPYYAFMDRIVMHRAWTPKFYEALQREFPDQLRGVSYEAAFDEWESSFEATWPSYLREPESEKAKLDKVRQEAMCQSAEVMLPVMDPINKAKVVMWMADNLSEYKRLFPVPLVLDEEQLNDYLEEQADAAKQAQENMLGGGGSDGGEDKEEELANPQEQGVPKPKAARDSQYALEFQPPRFAVVGQDG